MATELQRLKRFTTEQELIKDIRFKKNQFCKLQNPDNFRFRYCRLRDKNLNSNFYVMKSVSRF